MRACQNCGRTDTGNDSTTCRWCGADLSTFGDSGQNPHQTSRTQWKLFEAAKAVGALLLGVVMFIIATIVSLGLPILFVMALVIGPSATIDNVKSWIPFVGGTSVCTVGWEWHERVSQRMIDDVERLPIDSGGNWTSRDFDRSVDILDGLLIYIDGSNPPEGMEPIQSLYAESVDIMIDVVYAIRDNDQMGLENSRREFDITNSLIDTELAKLNSRCQAQGKMPATVTTRMNSIMMA